MASASAAVHASRDARTPRLAAGSIPRGRAEWSLRQAPSARTWAAGWSPTQATFRGFRAWFARARPEIAPRRESRGVAADLRRLPPAEVVEPMPKIRGRRGSRPPRTTSAGEGPRGSRNPAVRRPRGRGRCCGIRGFPPRGPLGIRRDSRTPLGHLARMAGWPNGGTQRRHGSDSTRSSSRFLEINTCWASRRGSSLGCVNAPSADASRLKASMRRRRGPNTLHSAVRALLSLAKVDPHFDATSATPSSSPCGHSSDDSICLESAPPLPTHLACNRRAYHSSPPECLRLETGLIPRRGSPRSPLVGPDKDKEESHFSPSPIGGAHDHKNSAFPYSLVFPFSVTFANNRLLGGHVDACGLQHR